LKSVARVLLAVIFILVVIGGTAYYINWSTNGKLVKLLQPSASASSGPTSKTAFYLSGGKVETPWVNGYDRTTAYAATGTSVTIYENWRYEADGQQLVKPNIILQRKTGKDWEAVKAGITFTTNTDIMVPTPSYKLPSGVKSQKVQYRFVSFANKGETGEITNTSYSAAATIIYENPKLYTGFAKTIYNDMKAYCPATVIHVVSASKKSQEAGKYSEGESYIEIDSKIRKYSVANQKTVALHECAHERQFLNFGSTPAGWDAMQTQAATIFTNDVAPYGVTETPHGDTSGLTFDPVEHAADCAALSVDPGGYLGYGGYCNGAELEAGRMLLEGYKF
jgi:hypothetical protein